MNTINGGQPTAKRSWDAGRRGIRRVGKKELEDDTYVASDTRSIIDPESGARTSTRTRYRKRLSSGEEQASVAAHIYDAEWESHA